MIKTIYILIGPQGSGKTHWANTVLLAHRKDIVRISQDEQDRGRHLDSFNKCLANGTSMVIDRMNFNREQRGRYTQPAMQLGYRVIFVWFDVSKDICLVRLARRKDHPTIPQNADHGRIIKVYFDQFSKPCLDEYDKMFTIDRKGRCCMLDTRKIFHDRKIIVVGDIHGCFDEFIELLDNCNYRPGDVVVATGDLVDRGPKCRETLEWFRNTPNAYSVHGNHDNKFMRYCKGNPVTTSEGLDTTVKQCQYLSFSQWAAWLQFLPLIIRLPDVNNKPMYVVHAGVDGRIPINSQRPETCMYARYLDVDNFFDKNGIRWWETLDGTYTVVSGHIITKVARPCGSVYCLDGGAFQGGVLRALVMNEGECQIHEVPSNVKS